MPDWQAIGKGVLSAMTPRSNTKTANISQGAVPEVDKASEGPIVKALFDAFRQISEEVGDSFRPEWVQSAVMDVHKVWKEQNQNNDADSGDDNNPITIPDEDDEDDNVFAAKQVKFASEPGKTTKKSKSKKRENTDSTPATPGTKRAKTVIKDVGGPGSAKAKRALQANTPSKPSREEDDPNRGTPRAEDL